MKHSINVSPPKFEELFSYSIAIVVVPAKIHVDLSDRVMVLNNSEMVTGKNKRYLECHILCYDQVKTHFLDCTVLCLSVYYRGENGF